MDNEMIIKQFSEIEKRIERLLGVCKSLESSNLELKNNIIRLEKELQGRREVESAYTEEKSLILKKIDSLLERLEDVPEVS